MGLAAFIDLVIYDFTTGFSPGPNNILLLSVTSRYGFKKSLKLMTGIWTGFLMMMILSALFCTALSTLVPAIQPYMKYVGAAYILYLAYTTAKRKPPKEGNAEDKAPSYWMGLTLQLVNVKVIIYGLTAYTSFILPYENRMPVLMLYAVMLMSAGAGGNILWSTVGSVLRRFYNKYYKIINGVMAVLLLWCAWKVIRG